MHLQLDNFSKHSACINYHNLLIMPMPESFNNHGPCGAIYVFLTLSRDDFKNTHDTTLAYAQSH